MGNDQWGLGLHFVFVTIFLVATTNTCLGVRNITVTCFEHERLALLKFKHSVRDKYHMLSSWVGNDCCRWERVTCNGVTGNVESLHLKGGFDVGFMSSKELDASLRELRHLKYLDLSWNNFQGRIPDFIGSLKQLTYLNLSDTGFSGIIPHHIGNLSNLKNLGLRSGDLTADDLTWLSGLPSLEHLDLSWVNLSGATNVDMVLYMFPSLKVLSLSHCGLYNADISSVGNSRSTSLSNIKYLDLSYNSFKGQLPHFFQNMTSLQFLDLSSFDFYPTWNFTNFLSTFPSLLGLRLSYCNLKETYLSHTLHNFTTLSNIKHLDLSHNMLTGRIPTFPRQLTELYLSNNYLNGSIPVSIWQLSELRSLDVSHNALEGEVSESHFANLMMLEDLNTAFNSKLTFNVSREWLPPFQLIRIDLSSCKIENGFPQWLQNQRKLQILRLSNATISGPLPTWLRKMPIIPFMDLSHNNLSGPLTNLPSGGTNNVDDFHDNLMTPSLFLQNNIFNESIPRSLCKRTDLYYLDLSRNRLNGEIPKCFKNLQYLRYMGLSSNVLSGVIPSSIGKISWLTSLQLNDNNFSGEFPAEIWNLSLLSVLDLGDNALCGKIPEWIGEKIKSLMVFRLHNNNFTGEIPQSLCKNFYLQVLDVAHNNLTGTIPQCLGSLQGMINEHFPFSFGEAEERLIQVMKGTTLEYTKTWSLLTNMDLSSNKLVGEIPVELTTLCFLMGLNLSNNHLSGVIPDRIGDMKALVSLDFSGNELSGPIPSRISALNFLSHLNLSNNNLSGRIPTGSQLQTLTDPSIYEGNNDLCGAPLPKNCSNPEDPTATAKSKYEASNEPNKIWFYLDITCGFATGFWGIIVVLVLNKQWRHKLFMFGEETMDKLHVAVMVRVNKMKRGKEAM